MSPDEIVIAYSLWGYDETPYRVLRNRIVVTRKPHTCAVCFESIETKTRVRAQSEALDGEARTFYVCPTCCSAILLDEHDGDCLNGATDSDRMAAGR